MKKFILALALALFTSAGARADLIVNNWISWNNPGSFPNINTNPYSYNYATSAAGTIILPNGTPVTVSLNGEIEQSLSAFGTSNNSFWASANSGGTTYISANVPELPSNSDRIGLEGWAGPTQTLTFSQPVSNLVMNVWSMGSSGNTGSYQFNRPFALLSQNGLLSVSGNELIGNEGAGTIQFTGTFTSLSWTVSSPEGSVWNIGVTSASASAVPEPGTWAAAALLAGGAAFARWRKRRDQVQIEAA